MNPANYLEIKNKIPSNVNILAVSKGFKSQEIKTIQNIGQNDFGESKVCLLYTSPSPRDGW